MTATAPGGTDSSSTKESNSSGKSIDGISVLNLNTRLSPNFTNLAVSGTSENRAWNEGKSKWLSSDLQKNVSREDRAPALRKTKIVGTVGPSSWSRDTLFPLLDFGMNVVRLNMSHGDHASHKAVVDLVKEYNASGRRTDKVGLLLDTKGPEVRSGDVIDKIPLQAGDDFTFTIDRTSVIDPLVEKKVTVNYDGFLDDVQVNDVLLVDGGMLSLQVREITDTEARCVTLEGGLFGSRRHLNVQGRSANLPAITEKDWEDLQFGVDEGVDYFALSFVRDAQVIVEVKQWLAERGAEISIIPKIESVDAVRNLDEILDAADGAMVARGDLGAELPVEEVPLIQSEIVNKCNQQGKPVIVATNMLESMIQNPTPTRAEVADITVAVREGADAVMLSGETANGKYPMKALEVMAAAAQRVPWELAPGPNTPFCTPPNNLNVNVMPIRQVPVLPEVGDSSRDELTTHLIAYNATNLANTLQVPIVVFTRSGFMASLLSHFRPRKQVFAFTNNPKVASRMSLYRGVHALLMDFTEDKVETQAVAIKMLQEQGHVMSGDQICLLSAGFNKIWRKTPEQGISFYTVE